MRPSTCADHIKPKTDDHRPAGLQGVCGPCHDRKSAREGGQAAAQTRTTTRRPPEPHPGTISS
ncbi:hypothetical protein [Kitasatospora sp. NPDC058478]|uniref:hypothetical protein n=1 Tax=unclassified Kitasatospora TaxID=2633591 RepID=UPI003650DB46